VTSVGGTSAAIGRHGHLKWQTGWGTVGYGPSADGRSWLRGGPLGGAGGGFSQLFRRPRWQHGVVPAGSPAGRGVPDVALDADGDTGLRVGQTQRFPSGDRYGELRIGGTSLAAPLMAGMQALAAQHAGGRLGWADPAIYRQARRHAGTFRDVTAAHDGRAVIRADYLNFLNARGGRVYTVRTIGDFSGFPLPLTTRRGWDPITGVGSPNRRYLTTQGR
jgi:subtilase family serine protease